MLYLLATNNGRYLNKQPHKMNLVAARRIENWRSQGIPPILRAQETGQNGITQATVLLALLQTFSAISEGYTYLLEWPQQRTTDWMV